MAHSTSRHPLAAKFDDFLYARIGEDKNGLSLTVLSALARQNVDPWEEAADLCRLRTDVAMRKLAAMIAALPQGALAEREPNAVAARLIGLLPHSTVFHLSSQKAIPSVEAVKRSPAISFMLSIAAYVALMLISQWLIASIQTSRHIDTAPTAAAGSAPPPAQAPERVLE
jgi:hypothetical protein